MKTGVTFILLLAILYSCHSTKKIQPTTYFFSDILSKDADTTYSYGVTNNLLYNGHTQYKFTLPDSLGGDKMAGFVDYYSMVNSNKESESIEILELAIRKNDKKFIYYRKGYDTAAAEKPYFKRLVHYIYETTRAIPLKQTKPATLKLHPTYCSISFGK